VIGHIPTVSTSAHRVMPWDDLLPVIPSRPFASTSANTVTPGDTLLPVIEHTPNTALISKTSPTRSARTPRITQRVSVRKLVLRENTSGNSQPWMMAHQTAMARVLQNFQDIQELVLDFLIRRDAAHLDDQHIFPQITPTRLRDCTKLTFRFIPRNTETFSADDVLVS
jgi:hypothetical protein